MIYFYQTKNIHNYKNIFEGLIDDFGYSYYHSILSWCEIIERKKSKFWEVWLIYNAEGIVIGICGLYSLTDNTENLWLGWFGIIKEYRNQGIGEKVLKSLEIKAKEVGCKNIYTYVDAKGLPLKFYYRNGFERVSDVDEFVHYNNLKMEYFESPDDHVLKKNLNNEKENYTHRHG